MKILANVGARPRRVPEGLALEAPWAVEHPETVATALVEAGEPPTRLTVSEEDLETYFLRLVTTGETGSHDVL